MKPCLHTSLPMLPHTTGMRAIVTKFAWTGKRTACYRVLPKLKANRLFLQFLQNIFPKFLLHTLNSMSGIKVVGVNQIFLCKNNISVLVSVGWHDWSGKKATLVQKAAMSNAKAFVFYASSFLCLNNLLSAWRGCRSKGGWKDKRGSRCASQVPFGGIHLFIIYQLLKKGISLKKKREKAAALELLSDSYRPLFLGCWLV